MQLCEVVTKSMTFYIRDMNMHSACHDVVRARLFVRATEQHT